MAETRILQAPSRIEAEARMKFRSVQITSFLCAVFLLQVFNTPFAWSQTQATTPEDLTRGSDVIAVGKVKELKSEWVSGKKAIVTRVTLDVDEFLKGGAGQTLTVLVPGGEVDGVGEWYSHTARFKKDEDVVLFAKKQGTSDFRVTGGESGKLIVTKDPRTGASVVGGGTALDDLKKRVRNTR
jgi:hypothetical protein